MVFKEKIVLLIHNFLIQILKLLLLHWVKYKIDVGRILLKTYLKYELQLPEL